MNVMQKVAEVAPRHYRFLTKTAAEIRSSPYKDEIMTEMSHLMDKAASFFSGAGAAAKSGLGMAGRGAAALGGAVGTAAAGGIALALAGDLYSAAKRGITKTRNYQAMMQANPQLAQLPSKNVQDAFSVLHRFNPEFAAQPQVAGSWVARQAVYGEGTFGNIQELKGLVDSHKNLVDSNKLMGVPEVKGLGNPGFGRKERKQLSDLNEGVTDVHDRLSKLEG